MSPHCDSASPFSGGYATTTPFRGFDRPSNLRIAHEAESGSDTPLSSDCESLSLDSRPSSARLLIPGVYVPTMCFFKLESEEIDTDTITQHAVRLARAGVTGLATQGSNGEAVHLTHAERQLVTATTRRALDGNGFAHMPLIVGCGSQSTRETIEFCTEAYESGGDYALVLPPSYYATLFSPGLRTIVDFFEKVADSSPIPIIIYNFPGAAGGLDLTSDVIVELAKHPNIAGVKLTCGNTGKLNRSMSGGGHGILAGLANIAPKACVRAFECYQSGNLSEAQNMQEVLSDGDWTAIQGGVLGVKAGLQGWMGYGGYARSPLPKPTADQAQKWKDGFRGLMSLEKSL
uniref:4-hydroxy-2-oxoglutarate aldolase, mitochondrial n=1 Tax=Bionectria ochroleuca TaxID=29856 RepID=A0A0B7K7H5_BIOOC